MRKISSSAYEPNECFMDDDGVMRIVLSGQYTLAMNEIASKMIDEEVARSHEPDKRAIILADVRKSTDIPPRARLGVIQYLRGPNVRRVAYLGKSNSWVETLIKFTMPIFDKDRFCYFTDEAEARAWLLGRKQG